MSNPCKLLREDVLVTPYGDCASCGYQVFDHRPSTPQPHSADGELEQIKNSLKLSLQKYAFSDPKQWFDSTGVLFEQEADYLITQVQAFEHREYRKDRKKHELEARLDELRDIPYDTDIRSEDGDTFTIKERITQLKKELDNLNNQR